MIAGRQIIHKQITITNTHSLTSFILYLNELSKSIPIPSDSKEISILTDFFLIENTLFRSKKATLSPITYNPTKIRILSYQKCLFLLIGYSLNVLFKNNHTVVTKKIKVSPNILQFFLNFHGVVSPPEIYFFEKKMRSCVYTNAKSAPVCLFHLRYKVDLTGALFFFCDFLKCTNHFFARQTQPGFSLIRDWPGCTYYYALPIKKENAGGSAVNILNSLKICVLAIALPLFFNYFSPLKTKHINKNLSECKPRPPFFLSRGFFWNFHVLQISFMGIGIFVDSFKHFFSMRKPQSISSLRLLKFNRCGFLCTSLKKSHIYVLEFLSRGREEIKHFLPSFFFLHNFTSLKG